MIFCPDLTFPMPCWHFAVLQQQSVPGDVSKYLSCTRDGESAISDPWFQGRHGFPPRRLRGLRAFLCSHNDVTPGWKSNKETLEGVGVRETASVGGTQVISAGNDSIAHAVAQSDAKFFQFIEGVGGMRNTASMGTTKKSLAQTHPALAKEADGWDPKLVTAGSGKKVVWKCRKGHRYESTIGSRTGQGSGCSYCVGKKILAGFNDLATTHPKLAREAHKWDPTTIGFGS